MSQRWKRNGWLLIGVSLVTLLLLAFPGAGSAGQPITISIIDNGGDLASTQVIIENYKKANPDKVKEIRTATASRTGPWAPDELLKLP